MLAELTAVWRKNWSENRTPWVPQAADDGVERLLPQNWHHRTCCLEHLGSGSENCRAIAAMRSQVTSRNGWRRFHAS